MGKMDMRGTLTVVMRFEDCDGNNYSMAEVLNALKLMERFGVASRDSRAEVQNTRGEPDGGTDEGEDT